MNGEIGEGTNQTPFGQDGIDETVAAVKTTNRPEVNGELRQRGRIWWLRYYRDGRRFEESSRTDKYEKAQTAC